MDARAFGTENSESSLAAEDLPARAVSPELAIIHELGNLFVAVFRSFASEIAHELSRPVTPAQLRFLQLLDLRPGITVAEAAKSLAITTPSACTAVGRLIEAGLAQQRADPVDKRVKHVHLTDAGADVVVEFEQAQARKVVALLRQLDAGQIENFRSTVRQITEALSGTPGH